MPRLSVDHLNLPVYDAQAALIFYRDVMGFRLTATYSGEDWGGHHWLMMVFAVGDGRQIALCKFEGLKKPERSGLPKDTPHYAFCAASKDELSGWRRRLEVAGIHYWEEDHGDRRSLYFPDPDGLILEVTGPSTEPDREDADAAERALRWLDEHGG